MKLTRRDFVKTSGAVAAAALSHELLAGTPHVVGSDRMRIGLIGCGGRGTGAAVDCARSAPGVEIIAMGDVFPDHLNSSREKLKSLGDKYRVADSKCFLGFDAYQKVVESGIDLAILATPPGFRPLHLRAAVDAGVHVFMEKPAAVDPVGVRSVFESADIAAAKGLSIVAGTQRRHHAGYVEAMRRIHGGAIGEIVSASCYWVGGELWSHPRKDEWSDMEYQLRNWLYYTWLSGDHIVEQHVHNLDVVNWALQAHPVKAVGMGGRQKRTGPDFGHIFDHFAVEYEYPGGIRVTSLCRQNDNCASNVSELLVGTRGRSNACSWIKGGRSEWKFVGEDPRPYVQEHTDLIAAIRSGKPLNEARRVAESTLTAIMGRESAYTGKEVTWEQAINSKLDLKPPHYEMGTLPVLPVPVPGTRELV